MKPNATRHGLLSECPVLDGFETQAGWLAHRQAFWDDLQPRGAVEETLVERIALTFWRMARLARAETAAANRHLEEEVARAGRVWSDNLQDYLALEEARAEIQRRDDLCDWLAAYTSHAAADPVPDPLSTALGLHLLAFLEEFEASRKDAETDLPPSLSAALSSGSRRPVSTAGGMRDCFDYVALLTCSSLDGVLQHVVAQAQASTAAFARSLRDAERQVEQVRGTTQLPAERDLQLFTRYDAHLGRELSRLFRTLKDLRAFATPSPHSSSNSSSPSNSDSKLPQDWGQRDRDSSASVSSSQTSPPPSNSPAEDAPSPAAPGEGGRGVRASPLSPSPSDSRGNAVGSTARRRRHRARR